MFQVSISSAVRSAIAAALFIGVVALGFTVREATSPDRSLGRADDYGTRHLPVAELSLADDYGTRQMISAGLDAGDDFGTRHPELSSAAAAELGVNDDYATRHGPPGR